MLVIGKFYNYCNRETINLTFYNTLKKSVRRFHFRRTFRHTRHNNRNSVNILNEHVLDNNVSCTQCAQKMFALRCLGAPGLSRPVDLDERRISQALRNITEVFGDPVDR